MKDTRCCLKKIGSHIKKWKGEFLLWHKEKKKPIKKGGRGIVIMAQWLMNPTSKHEDSGSTPGLAQWVKDLVLL